MCSAGVLALVVGLAVAESARASVYWANSRGDSIGRANLDGTSPDQSFITGAENPVGVAVDGTRVYWADAFGGSIGRANLDGTSPDQSFITGADGPVGVAVDPLPTLEVRKALSPASDPGRFDLAIDGQVLAAAVGDGGTTGALTRNAGTYTISEAGAGGTDLDDYATAIACADGQQGQGPALQVQLSQTPLVCTVENVRKTGPPPPAPPAPPPPPAPPAPAPGLGAPAPGPPVGLATPVAAVVAVEAVRVSRVGVVEGAG